MKKMIYFNYTKKKYNKGKTILSTLTKKFVDERVNNLQACSMGGKIQLQTIYRKTEIKTKEFFFLLYFNSSFIFAL